MSEELEVATPATQESAEQVQEVETKSPDATAEQTQDQQAETNDEPKRKPWFQDRIDTLTREKYEARRAAEEASHQAEQYRQHLAQLQHGQQTEQQPNSQNVDVRTLAQQEAARMLAEQRFNEACNKVYATGKSSFQDFDQAVANLQMVGASREFLELATASDAGHKVLHHLGTDLDEASRILSLPPLLMARELTRLEMKLEQPQAKPVSNAPAPITPISGAKGGSKDPSEMTDAEFAKWRKSQIAARR